MPITGLQGYSFRLNSWPWPLTSVLQVYDIVQTSGLTMPTKKVRVSWTYRRGITRGPHNREWPSEVHYNYMYLVMDECRNIKHWKVCDKKVKFKKGQMKRNSFGKTIKILNLNTWTSRKRKESNNLTSVIRIELVVNCALFYWGSFNTTGGGGHWI